MELISSYLINTFWKGFEVLTDCRICHDSGFCRKNYYLIPLIICFVWPLDEGLKEGLELEEGLRIPVKMQDYLGTL